MTTAVEFPDLAPIPDWHQLDEAARQKVRDGKAPVVLRGLALHWPLVQLTRQSFSDIANYLLQFDAGKMIEAKLADAGQGGRLFYAHDMKSFNFKSMRGYLKDAMGIFQSLFEREDYPVFYLGAIPVSDSLPGMEDELRLPLADASAAPNLWLASRARVAAHNDDAENIACVAAGRRRFTLYPPEQEQNLYIGPPDFTPAGRPISLVDFDQPDFEQFPRFADALACAQSAELGPGDAIYIPRNWWHQVDALERFNALVNFWWQGHPPNFC